MHSHIAAFAELPWDVIWKASVTLAAIAVLLLFTSKIVVEIVKRAITVLLCFFVVVGAYYSYKFVKEGGLLEAQIWSHYWVIVNNHLNASTRSEISYFDQIKAVGQAYVQNLRF
jgi:hypothetical protein